MSETLCLKLEETYVGVNIFFLQVIHGVTSGPTMAGFTAKIRAFTLSIETRNSGSKGNLNLSHGTAEREFSNCPRLGGGDRR